MGNVAFKGPEELAEERRQSLLRELEQKRKGEEAEGVVINGVRYAGDPSNRQALLEVVQFAREAGITEFPSWKDSDGSFRQGHPLTEVEQALMQIATRRGALIALESGYAAQILAGVLTEVDGLNWGV